MPCTAPHRAARWATVAAAAGALALAGCGDPTAPLTPADVTGTYALVSIGGRPLPTTPPTAPGTTSRTMIVSDTITCNAQGTWTESARIRAVDPDSAPRVLNSSGTWVLDASSQTVAATFPGSYPSSQSYTLTFRVRDRGQTLTYSIGTSDEYRYVKQR